MVEIVAGKQRAPVAAGVYNVYTGELADTATPTAARMGLEPPGSVRSAVAGWSSRSGPTAGGRAVLATGRWTRPTWRHSGDRATRFWRTVRAFRCTADVADTGGPVCDAGSVGDRCVGRWPVGVDRPANPCRRGHHTRGERVHEYLGSESQNFFIAPFMLLGLLSVLAVVASALMWQWREHRGPQMVAGLSIGLTTAAAIAAGVGALVVRLRYGALDFDTVPLSRGDHALTYVTQAPPVFFARRPLQIALTLMWPAGIASLVYALLAAGTARDDLGGYPAVDPSSNARTEALETPQAPVS